MTRKQLASFLNGKMSYRQTLIPRKSNFMVNPSSVNVVARALLQTFLANRSYREVPVRGGRVDILSLQKEGRILYEAKIWRGEKYHAQGIREISEYLKGEDDDNLFAVFYVVFDSTKTYCSKSYLGESFTVERIGIHDVHTITICLAPPQPSTVKPSS